MDWKLRQGALARPSCMYPKPPANGPSPALTHSHPQTHLPSPTPLPTPIHPHSFPRTPTLPRSCMGASDAHSCPHLAVPTGSWGSVLLGDWGCRAQLLRRPPQLF